jgi:hypothetical protein
MLERAGSSPGFTLVWCLLLAALTWRFILEYLFLLPSPVGDPAYFITATANYCRAGFLGTTAFPIDPSGQSRMIWHGFVSPMLFRALSFSCEAQDFYLGLWLIKVATVVSIMTLARWRNYPALPTFGAALLALAAQTSIGFRPETLAILWVVLAELASERGRYLALGAIAAALLCTQPTVAGIYVATMVILRTELIKHWLAIAVGGSGALLVLLFLYPFPILDLIQGVGLQAHRLIGRSDGGVIGYYLLMPALPGWILLLILAAIPVARRRPALLLLIPVLWFFGPRVPPIYYNLVPTCILLILVGVGWATPKFAKFLGAAAIASGLLGLGFVGARDSLTVLRYGNTFAATRNQVAQLAAAGFSFASVPAFLALTNPELRFTDPTASPRQAVQAATRVTIFAANGTPHSPCRGDGSVAPTVKLAIGPWTFFNSNSGWMIYVCH